MRWTMGVNGNQDWVEGSGGGSGAEGTFEPDSFDPRFCLVYIASEFITYSRFRKRCPLPFFSPGYDRSAQCITTRWLVISEMFGGSGLCRSFIPRLKVGEAW